MRTACGRRCGGSGCWAAPAPPPWWMRVLVPVIAVFVTFLVTSVLILLVGGMVGFIVAAMLLPVFRLTSGL